MKITKEIVNVRLKDRGIKLIGEYTRLKDRSLFRCDCSHEWVAIVSSVTHYKTGCPVCSQRIKLTKEEINQRLQKYGTQLLDEYQGSNTFSRFKCVCGNDQWITKPSHAMNGIHCKQCSESGFRIDKPAHIYILRFDSFIKFGISNDIDYRLKKHRRSNGEFVVVAMQFFERGRDALDWETSIKREHGGRFATQAQCPDGYTETLSLDKEQIIVETLGA
jgi:hypothetical protein